MAGIIASFLLINGFTLLYPGQGASSSGVTFEEGETFSPEWKKVDSLINAGLPRTALELTASIYQRAKDAGNQPQFIKAVLYRIRLTADYEESFMESTVADLKDELSTAAPPAAQLLHSILADIYWRYFQANRNLFYDRTMVVGSPGDDIATWDLNTLMDRIIYHYFASLGDPGLLKDTPLEVYDPILDTARGSKSLRPSLYDFLAHRAVDFFMNDESAILQPAYRFELDREEDFAGAGDFIDYAYATNDSLSLKYHALLIFQDLLAFHLRDDDPAAFADVNLKRLAFVHGSSVHPLKDSLYVSALKDFHKKVEGSPAAADVAYALASELYRQSSAYDPRVSDANRWKAREAAEVCEDAIASHMGSTGAGRCELLLQSITATSFRVTLEKENLPGIPMLALLNFKNVSAVHFRMVRLDYEMHRTMLRELRQRDELLDAYLKMDAVASWSQQLPDAGDHQEHGTEIRIPPAERGHYLLLASESPAFLPDSGTISYQTFWATSISFISRGQPGGGYGVYVLDRETGAPLAGVRATLYYRSYDYALRSYRYVEGGRFDADEQGYFSIPPAEGKENPGSFYLEFKTDDDILITDDRFYDSGYKSRDAKPVVNTYLFTDRSIYRPGQTVYFKGIVVEKEKEQRTVKAGHKSTVEFLDVNYQEVSALELVTNEYGSFQGSFVIPHGTLNGRMTIRNETGTRGIQVEEYKRPNFEVFFNPVRGSYKLGEPVTVEGQARAFAGNDIAGATVRYRVVRETFYPWRQAYRGYYPMRPSMEITNGSVVTADDGTFTIQFTAIPDPTLPARMKPAFSYTVYADVTDINNETQSGTESVRVGPAALLLEMAIGEAENIHTLRSIPFRTTNLNGQPLATRGRMTIAQLREPDRMLREQLWQQPDMHVMQQEEFEREFPYDSYRDENDPSSLQVRSVVLDREFDSREDSVMALTDVHRWKPGRYRITMESTDEYGTPVKETRYFILYAPDSNSPPVEEINWFHVLKNRCEPGEKASFLIGSAEKDVRVLYEVVHKEAVVRSEWLDLGAGQKLVEVPVTEEQRGGFRINLIFVRHNRIFNNSFAVDVPYTNKQLDIEFLTFRSDLGPGQDESWSLRISGKNGDRVAAELMTSMYDQSLDKFTGHDWMFSLFGMPYHGGIWTTNMAFHNTAVSKYFNRITERNYLPDQGYDQLNWFGFGYFGGYYYTRGGRVQPDMMARQEAMPGKLLEVVDEDQETALKQGSETGEPGDGEVPEAPEVTPDDAREFPQVRRDFRETAFFFPSLRTDENGEVIIEFKVPESLTRWKLMGLAHTKDLMSGQFVREVTTRKELMVIPNPPRFFRQGDRMEFTAKLVNLTDTVLSGSAAIHFYHTPTMKEITSEVLTENGDKPFRLTGKENASVSWRLTVPEAYGMISYRVTAASESHTDAEERALPVLTNRMLVTESLPLPVGGNETKEFRFDKLAAHATGGTLVNHKLTLEFASNPAWYAVQALPYVMEDTRESADDVFNRFYANAVAAFIVNSNPRIRAVFDTWKELTPDAFLSNLEKNQDLKSVILEETPWVRDAADEQERKQRVALLFDLNRMADEQAGALRLLARKQSPGGGWPWFRGMPDNRHITQQIVLGFGHLKQLGVYDGMKEEPVRGLLIRAIAYLDEMVLEDYERLLEQKADLDKVHIGSLHVQYLYARSFFLEALPLPDRVGPAADYYRAQSEKYWNKQGLLQKALIAMTLKRTGRAAEAEKILASVREYALYSQEMGMYWRENQGGYHWHEAPIETQAFLIEAFDEVRNDKEAVDRMKTWLLKQKQTRRWETPRATAAAVYALLLRGGEWLTGDRLVEVTIGGTVIDPTEMEDTRVEAGTGYFTKSWPAGQIDPAMAAITVRNENPGIAWGAVYWQYFEDLDRITFAETPLGITKSLFVRRNTGAGPVLVPLDGNVGTGDEVIVRIEIRVDRDMEYVHLKDMRAAAFEPVNVISGYRYQGGLGYYESTRDASTDFFMEVLPKGTYVFEYPLVAAQKGEFSNGITTIQCMYAPEFTSHSEGVRVVVE